MTHGRFTAPIRKDTVIEMKDNLNRDITALLAYARENGILFSERDTEYAVNNLLHLLGEHGYQPCETDGETDIVSIMSSLLDYAGDKGLIDKTDLAERDRFEAKIIDQFLPAPSVIDRAFRKKYKIGPMTATRWFYALSKATNYIKTRRIAKNKKFVYDGSYGPLDLTINLSKPEKDPKKIAAAGEASKDYPKCPLCVENVGFYGNDRIQPRSNHRIVTLTLNHEKNAWGLQYSPYAYFNEHCIVLKKEHVPMKVDEETFLTLVEFVNKFPHYLIGSNAGLPIVGGSILNHYHFQGGRYDFPIEKARVIDRFKRRRVKIEVLDWPLSTIRVVGKNENRLLDMVNDIVNHWRGYDNEALGILSKTDTQHNTVTPIVKLKGSEYHFYIVLRNNRTTDERPYGLFHPREDYFHIKKENIGLIEVMGLAVLPGRLDKELALIETCIRDDGACASHPELEKHMPWIRRIRDEALRADDLPAFLRREVGRVFEQVLEDCGVFKRDDKQAFIRFAENAVY